MNFEQAREKMVDCQVRPSDVTNHELLAAMLSVPREEFVGEELKELAYLDRNVKIATNRFMMPSAALSKLIQLADPQPENVALVVGAGTGYGCAVLSSLVLSVVGIEEDEQLMGLASDNLSRLGYDNVAILYGKLAGGWEREGPYDVILLEGSVEQVPETLLDQLAEGGRLVAVVGKTAASAKLYTKSGGLLGEIESFNCSLKKLPGFSVPKEFAL